MHVPVPADVQVKMIAQSGPSQLQRRQRPDVAGKHRLPDATLRASQPAPRAGVPRAGVPRAGVPRAGAPCAGRISGASIAGAARSGLVVGRVPGKRGYGGGRAGQRANSDVHGGVRHGNLAGQRGEKVVHLAAGRVQPGHRQRVKDDRPVGPPRLRRDRGQLPAEHFPEHHLVQARAQPVGAHQRVVHVPQHQQFAHPPRLASPAYPSAPQEPVAS
jgi:hypothetical protein